MVGKASEDGPSPQTAIEGYSFDPLTLDLSEFEKLPSVIASDVFS
jgi:hypothetical protein